MDSEQFHLPAMYIRARRVVLRSRVQKEDKFSSCIVKNRILDSSLGPFSWLYNSGGRWSIVKGTQVILQVTHSKDVTYFEQMTAPLGNRCLLEHYPRLYIFAWLVSTALHVRTCGSNSPQILSIRHCMLLKPYLQMIKHHYSY